MLIGLFTTRIVLQRLGDINYGIYSVVAGLVGMLAVFQTAMSMTTMRYLSHSLGGGDLFIIRKTFNTTLFLHFIIGFIVFLAIELGGIFLLNSFLNIPSSKLFEAKVVYHLMALTTFVVIIAVPYDAVINAHENLVVLSVVDVLGSLLRLVLALLLILFGSNVLIPYAIGMFLIEIILRVLKQGYSKLNYLECRINFKFYDKALLKEIVGFFGWNFIGAISMMTVVQVRSIILNVFFGVKVNASEGIAKTASDHVNMVSVNLTRAINPQLVKSEGAGDRDRVFRITNISTKYSIILFSLFAIPIIIEMPLIFDLWLNSVPEFAVIFARLSLISILITKFTNEIPAAFRAIGKMKIFQIYDTIILLLNIPISYYLFKINFPQYSIYIVGIVISILSGLYRIYIAHKIINLDYRKFYNEAIKPTLLPFIVASCLGFIVYAYFPYGIFRFLFNLFICTISVIGITYFLVFDKSEKQQINNVFFSIKKYIHK